MDPTWSEEDRKTFLKNIIQSLSYRELEFSILEISAKLDEDRSKKQNNERKGGKEKRSKKRKKDRSVKEQGEKLEQCENNERKEQNSTAKAPEDVSPKVVAPIVPSHSRTFPNQPTPCLPRTDLAFVGQSRAHTPVDQPPSSATPLHLPPAASDQAYGSVQPASSVSTEMHVGGLPQGSIGDMTSPSLADTCLEQLPTHPQPQIGLTTAPQQASLNDKETSRNEINNNIKHSCSICGQTFVHLKNLEKHKKRHSGQRNPLQCSDCNKSFPNIKKLNRHQKTHAKPYICDSCDKTFADKDSLNRHKRTHNVDKFFICTGCTKSFRRECFFMEHQKNCTQDGSIASNGPTILDCNVCQKKFLDKEKLKKHKLLHATIKYYNCSNCEKSFAHCSGKNAHEEKCLKVKQKYEEQLSHGNQSLQKEVHSKNQDCFEINNGNPVDMPYSHSNHCGSIAFSLGDNGGDDFSSQQSNQNDMFYYNQQNQNTMEYNQWYNQKSYNQNYMYYGQSANAVDANTSFYGNGEERQDCNDSWGNMYSSFPPYNPQQMTQNFNPYGNNSLEGYN